MVGATRLPDGRVVIANAGTGGIRFYAGALADARSDNHRGQLERAFGEMSVRETLPVFVDLVVDAEGYLWVERYREAGEHASHWDLFDWEGRWFATVAMPLGLEVYEIGSDYILGGS